MTTSQMEYFLTAAELRSFTAAAERFFMTQPALSHQISNMENELGAKLFVRGNNTVQLTPAGVVLYRGLKTLVPEYHELVTQVENVSLGITGEFTIGVLEDILLDRNTVSAIKQLKAQRPGLNINLKSFPSQALWDGLLDGSIHVAVTLMSFTDNEKFDGKVLGSEGIYLAISASADEAKQDHINYLEFLELLREYPLLLMTNSSTQVSIRDAASEPIKTLNEMGCHPLVTLIPTITELVQQVAAGLGVIIVNRTHVLSGNPGIKLIELDFNEKERQIWPNFQRGLIWNKGTTDQITKSFIACLEEMTDSLSFE